MKRVLKVSRLCSKQDRRLIYFDVFPFLISAMYYNILDVFKLHKSLKFTRDESVVFVYVYIHNVLATAERDIELAKGLFTCPWAWQPQVQLVQFHLQPPAWI